MRENKKGKIENKIDFKKNGATHMEDRKSEKVAEGSITSVS